MATLTDLATAIGKDVKARLPIEAPELSATTDLNTVTTPGYYSQPFSSRATTELHYPLPRAGRLWVQANAARTQVSQLYWTFDATANMQILARNFYQSWGEWRNILAAPPAAGDVVYRGVIANGTDVSTIRTAGVYSVPSTAVAGTLVGWPTNRAGTLEVWGNSGASLTVQRVVAMVSSTAPTEVYTRATLSTLNTAWSPWATTEWTKGTLNGSSSARAAVDTYRTPGSWVVSNRTYVDGLPGTGTGVLEVVVTPAVAMTMQRYTERVANDQINVWHRFTLLTGGFSGIAWDLLNKPIPDAGAGGASRTSDVQVSDHATRVEYARSRRGGGIGTDGRAVIMLRFDHWLVAFRDKVLPILRKHNIVGTLNVNYDNLSNVQNGGGSISWSDVQAWNQYDGIEIANHGSTHTNVATMATIYHEIVEGRRNLEAAMPRVAVETWQEHGSAYLVAGDLSGDTGLDLGRTLDSFTSSYAGRLVMAEHAVVEGKSGGFFVPLTGTPQVGQSHYSVDQSTAAEVADLVTMAVEMGRGLTIYGHPGLLDTILVGSSTWPVTYGADGSRTVNPSDGSAAQTFPDDAAMRAWAASNGYTVYMTASDLDAVCANLAARRDAGDLIVATAAGGGFADASHARRANILMSPTFENTSRWSGLTQWTISNPGPNVTLTSSASATTFSQGLLLFTRFGWAMGATHELVVRAKASTATTLTLSMEQLGNPTNWKTEKVHTVPGDGVEREYRLNLTLPRDRSITQMTARIGGPSLTIVGPPMLAAI